LNNCFWDSKSRLAKVSLVLFVLIILTLAAIALPGAKANDEYLQLSPAQGPAGTPVSVYGLGFKTGSISISFGSTSVATAYTGMFGRVTSAFTVPSVSPGVYTVTATGPGDSVGTATFTVTSTKVTQTFPSAYIGLSPTQGPAGTTVTVDGQGFSIGVSIGINFDGTNMVTVSADSSGKIHATFTVPSTTSGAHTVTATGSGGTYDTAMFTVPSTFSSGATGLNPTYKPAQTPAVARGGFWSPLTIGLVLVAAAIALIVPVAFVFRRRGNQEMVYEEDQPVYNPTLSTTSKKPTTATSYGQPDRYSHQFSMRPTEATRYNQSGSMSPQLTKRPTVVTKYDQPTSTRSQQSYATKICRNCKQTVRADLNVCPHCMKRLK
jgi:hypothetical protein